MSDGDAEIRSKHSQSRKKEEQNNQTRFLFKFLMLSNPALPMQFKRKKNAENSKRLCERAYPQYAAR